MEWKKGRDGRHDSRTDPVRLALTIHDMTPSGTLFDTEAIHALVAPRPHLELSGDQDPGALLDGVETLERKVGEVYRLYGKPGNFRSVVWSNTGHEYLPEMRDRMIAWFEKHLPVR